RTASYLATPAGRPSRPVAPAPGRWPGRRPRPRPRRGARAGTPPAPSARDGAPAPRRRPRRAGRRSAPIAARRWRRPRPPAPTGRAGTGRRGAVVGRPCRRTFSAGPSPLTRYCRRERGPFHFFSGDVNPRAAEVRTGGWPPFRARGALRARNGSRLVSIPLEEARHQLVAAPEPPAGGRHLRRRPLGRRPARRGDAGAGQGERDRPVGVGPRPQRRSVVGGDEDPPGAVPRQRLQQRPDDVAVDLLQRPHLGVGPP